MTTVSVVNLVRIFLSVVALVIMIMAIVAWHRRRRAPDSAIVALLMASAAIYCFGYSGEVVQTSLGRAFFWLHVEYFGIPWIPALWLLLARRHNGLPTRVGLLFVIPAIAFVGQLSNSLHGLYDRSLVLIPRGPFWVVSVERGPIAWLYLAYLHVALLYGAWIYISKVRGSSRLFRVQTFILLGACLVPLAGYFVYLCGWSPWGLDLAPLTFGLSAILCYLAIFKLNCFDLIPMARSLVFNSMRDAALVTDLRRRLVDVNHAARELLPCLAMAEPGDDIAGVLSTVPTIGEALYEPGTREVDLTFRGEVQHFQMRVFPLRVEKQQLGWAMILANITDQVRLVHELRRDAETDELTGVANRRRFLAAIERESARSVRYRVPFAVISLDLDNFKIINDRFGHPAGDKVLQTVAKRMVECLRGSDLLSRYGGDEFAVLLPETGMDGAVAIAERIRAAVAACTIESANDTLAVSISIGLATHDPAQRADWRRVLEEADQALYRAKASGRNRVATWKGLSSASGEQENPEITVPTSKNEPALVATNNHIPN